MQKRLDEVNITANKNTVPDDPQKPTVASGLRLGTPAVTARGFKEAEMRSIARWIKTVAVDFEASREAVIAEVKELCDRFPIY